MRITDYKNRNDEIGELAAAFNAMADSLAQAEQKRSEFVANVSHELKTPMTTIAGFADGILDGTIPRKRSGSPSGDLLGDPAPVPAGAADAGAVLAPVLGGRWPPRSSLTPPKSSSGCWSAWRPRSPRERPGGGNPPPPRPRHGVGRPRRRHPGVLQPAGQRREVRLPKGCSL